MVSGGSNQAPPPSTPGWYPDPWSATGRGERYFDGDAWGKTDRPIGRELSALDGGKKPSRFRRRRTARTSRPRRGRFRNTAWPFVLLALTVGAVWGAGQYNDRQEDGGSDTSAPAVGERAGLIAERPPPSDEAKLNPLGTPAQVPEGGGAFEFLAHQDDDPTTPAAFDPCRPIHYVIRHDGAPPDGEQLIHESVARVSTATGLQFIDDGATTELPPKDRQAYQPDLYDDDRWAPVVIAWSDEAQYPGLAGYIGGLGSASWERSDTGAVVNVSGMVVLDRVDLSSEVLPDRAYARATIMHELGHVVGLDHVADRGQIMFSEGQPGVTEYGAGDLAGLAELGTQECYPDL